MPLDLSDDQLFLEGSQLDSVLSRLDSNGWNTDGRLNRTTWMRVWFQHCRIREDILEIALGSDDQDVAHRADQIRIRMERLHASYPAFMRMLPEDVFEKNVTALSAGFASGRAENVARQINAVFLLCKHIGRQQT